MALNFDGIGNTKTTEEELNFSGIGEEEKEEYTLLKRLFEPITKQATGKTFAEHTGLDNLLEKKAQSLTKEAVEKAVPVQVGERTVEPAPTPSTAEFFAKQLPSSAGDVGLNIADLSPFDIAMLAATKGIGGIGGKSSATLGQIARKVPIGKGFAKGVKELNRLQKTLAPFKGQIGALKGADLSLATARKAAQEAFKNNPVNKIISALKNAKPIRKAQEILFTTERGKKAAVASDIGKTVTGEAGFQKQLGALKGKLGKVEFEGIRDKVSQGDIDSTFNLIENSGLDFFEKITAKTGLSRLLGGEGGMVPTKGQISLLEKVFPKEFITTILKKRPLIERFGEGFNNVINIPRAMMSTFDMSAPLRQGAFLIGRPKQWLPAFGNMFKYFGSEKSYQGLLDNIHSRPTWKLMKQGGLQITKLGRGLTSREEDFMSNIPEKIPLFGKIVRGSSRAHTGFLDKLRADTFDDIIKLASKQKVDITDDFVKGTAKFINAATGRGDLPKALKNMSSILNATIFSPRLASSRISLMNPHFYAKLPPLVRKEAFKSLLSFSGIMSSVVMLSRAAGAEVELDPRSSDFAKIKIGSTRYDPWAGFQQYARFIAQFISGERKSSTTGVIYKAGEGYKPETRKTYIDRFIESKQSPAYSYLNKIMKDSGFGGQDLDISEETANLFIPMVVQDGIDLVKEGGFKDVGMVIPAVFGMGMQTYSPDPRQIVSSARSAARYAKQLSKQGRDSASEEILENNKDITNLAKKLVSDDKEVSRLERRIKDTEDSVKIKNYKKQELIDGYNIQIQKLEEQMEFTAKKHRLMNRGNK